MSFLRLASALALMLCFALPSSGRAWAQATDDSGDPSGAEDEAGEPSPEEPPEIVRARELFLEGAALAKKSRWAEALASFEQSARLRPHAVTSYNIGACLRAMGRFVQARVHLDRADALDAAAGAAQLSEAMREKAAQFREDIDASMVQLSIAVKPNEVMLAIDGRPLARDGGSETAPRYLAGIREPGPAEKVAAERFEVLIDPGVHVIRLSRRGYRSRIHNQSMAPGKRVRVTLALERLPATLIVDADRDAALVTIDGKDAGFAPVRLARPGGSYRVLVEKEGYVPYATTARVDPGEVWRVRAKLPDEEPALYERWWFWTAAGAVVTGAVIGTYFATRPEPQKPPPDGGGFGWYVEVP